VKRRRGCFRKRGVDGIVQCRLLVLRPPNVRVAIIPEDYQHSDDAEQNSNVEIEYSWNHSILSNLKDLEIQNHESVSMLVD
jgi:hypothetical protein